MYFCPNGWNTRNGLHGLCQLIIRSLEEFDASVSVHDQTLEKDLLIKHHLGIMKSQLLEPTLLSIIRVR